VCSGFSSELLVQQFEPQSWPRLAATLTASSILQHSKHLLIIEVTKAAVAITVMTTAIVGVPFIIVEIVTPFELLELWLIQPLISIFHFIPDALSSCSRISHLPLAQIWILLGFYRRSCYQNRYQTNPQHHC